MSKKKTKRPFHDVELAARAGRESGKRMQTDKKLARAFSMSGNRAKSERAAVFAADAKLVEMYAAKRKISMKIAEIRHAVRADYKNLAKIDAAYAKACAAEIAQRDALNAKISERKAKIVDKLKAQTIMPGVK